MTDHKLTLEDLRRQVEPLEGYIGRKMQHVKTADFYVVSEIVYRESDMSIEFVYKTLHRKPVTFTRPIAELIDGRFRFT